MPLPPFLTTSNTVRQWLNATNNLISHVDNTSVYILVAQNATPRVSTGNISLNGTMILGTSVINSTFYSGSVNNATFAYGKPENGWNVNTAVFLYGNTVTTNTTVLSIGANVMANTSAVMMGNSTVNSTHTATLVTLANTTARANLTATEFKAGSTLSMNSTYVTMGNPSIGYPYAYITASDLQLWATGSYGRYDRTTMRLNAAQVFTPVGVSSLFGTDINTTGMFASSIVVNSTAMSASPLTINSSTIIAGANTTLTPSTLRVGNSTVNVVMNTTGIVLPPSLGLNSNTLNLLENRNGQLFFNGNRVDLISEYSAVYGYALGGSTALSSGYIAATDRITFSSGVMAAITQSNLSGVRGAGASVSDCATFGYAMGGISGATYLTTTDRTAFSTSVTVASTISNLSLTRSSAAGLSDGAAYGYAIGGYASGVGDAVTTADRITFSTSLTAASTASNLSAKRTRHSAVSDGLLYGYCAGGYSSSWLSSMERLTFSTSITAAYTTASLSLSREDITSVSDGTNYGYFLGGASASDYDTADRITFSTGTAAANTASKLSVARSQLAGMSDGATYGYAMGGWSGGLGARLTLTDRITFSTGATAAASTTSNLTVAKRAHFAFSDGAV